MTKTIKKILSCLVLVGFIFTYKVDFLFSRTAPFVPGETLNPDCAPGDLNCTVSINNDLNGDSITSGIVGVEFGGTGAISLNGILFGNGTGPITGNSTTDNLTEGSNNLYFSNTRTINSILTGFNIGLADDSSVEDTDSVLQAFAKLQNQINAKQSLLVQSDSTHSGFLTSADWSIFNNKLSVNGDGSLLTGITKAQIGLGNIENTALSTWAGSSNLITLGAATAASINKVNITSPTTSATLTIANGKTLTASNTITLTGIDGSTLNIGSGGTLGSNAFNSDSYYLSSNPNSYIALTSLSSTATGLDYNNTTGIFSLDSGYLIPTTTSYNNTNWDNAYADRNKWDGGDIGLIASTGRESLGATTVGSNLFTLTNPSAVNFLRVNADNTISALDAATFRTAIGAGTSSTIGTVTSVGGTGTINGLTLSGTVTSTGNLTLSGSISGITNSNLSGSAAISNSNLANSSLTIGTTNISLGSSSTTLAGLTSISSTSLTGSLTGNADTATKLATTRGIYGNNFDGSAALTQIIASTYGGTGNGFTKFSGPTASEKTFTLPDSNATLLYSGGALGTPSSGTLTNATGLPVSTGISGLGTGVATFLSTPSSANLASAITDETGTGLSVFGTSPNILTSLTTTSTSFSLLNTSATTLNVGGEATALSIGAATGTATVNNATLTLPNATSLNMNGVSPTISSTSTGTLSLFNTNLLTVNAFGAATTITLGNKTTAQTVNIATGAITTGLTKTINIGTSGANGSTTAINIGSTTGTNVIKINGRTNTAGVFVPSVTSTSTTTGIDLGSTAARWRYVYASQGTINTSDRTLKDNIADINYGLNDLLSMNPVQFDWKDNGGHSIGFIAQEMKTIIPEVVVGEEGSMGINYAELTPIIVKGVQELDKKVKDLEIKLGSQTDNTPTNIVSSNNTPLLNKMSKNILILDSNTELKEDVEVVMCKNLEDMLLTLPEAKNMKGKEIVFKLLEDSKIMINTLNNEKIDGDEMMYLQSKYEKITLISDGENWYKI